MHTYTFQHNLSTAILPYISFFWWTRLCWASVENLGSACENAHNSWTLWYIDFKFCILMYFNIVQPLSCKTVTRPCRASFWPVTNLLSIHSFCQRKPICLHSTRVVHFTVSWFCSLVSFILLYKKHRMVINKSCKNHVLSLLTPVGELIVCDSSRRLCVSLCVRLSNINITETSGTIAIKSYLKQHWGRGRLVSMATDSSHRVIMRKTVSPLFLGCFWFNPF